MNKRPKLLFLCQTTPWPLDGGGWIRSYHVLRLLARCFDVTALYFERTERSRGGSNCDAQEAISALRHLGAAAIFAVPQNHSRMRYVWDHLRSLLLGGIHTHYVYEAAAFRRHLVQLLVRERFDLVQINGLDLLRYLPEDVPAVCSHFDIESELWRRRARTEPVWFRRWYFAHQATRMAELERRWAPRFALNITVSEQDRVRLLSLAPGANAVVVPNGVDIEEFQPAEACVGESVVFVGGTTWLPNLDALNFFCAEILPYLREAGQPVPVRWVGSCTVTQQRHYWKHYGVELTGYVEDVRPYLRKAICQMVPLRAGGGTRLKILNAWASGCPVISTRVGCEGLEAVDGENILIRDDPREFANAILRLQRDHELRRLLGRRAREKAERVYSWDVIGSDMLRFYLDVIIA